MKEELVVVILFAAMLIGGCWAWGNIGDGWKAHDERCQKVRSGRGVPAWMPVREGK